MLLFPICASGTQCYFGASWNLSETRQSREKKSFTCVIAVVKRFIASGVGRGPPILGANFRQFFGPLETWLHSHLKTGYKNPNPSSLKSLYNLQGLE